MKPTAKTDPAKVTQPAAAENVYAFPMSFAQQRLWFLDQFEPGNTLYNIVWPMRLRGALNVAALEKSLNEIVRRHEVLRATFTTIDDKPVQVIAPSLTLTFAQTDLSNIPQGEQQEQIQHLANAEARTPISLQAGPMLRASLVQLGEEEHVLVLTLHHIVSDRWSRGVFFRELTILYDTFSKNERNPLPELPLQYTDFAVWQRQFLSGKNLEKQLSYWKQQLAGAPATLELPTDRPRPPLQSFNGQIHSFRIPADLVNEVKALSRREGVTPFMVLLGGLQTLFSRYSGQEDVVVGTPIANRNRTEIENLIGFFANTLALRTSFSGNPTFRELLTRVREVALGAYAHQDLPFEKLVEELKPERSLSYNPVFQVLLAVQNAPTQELKLAGLALEGIPVQGEGSKFDLALFLSEAADGMYGRLEYNTDIFDQSTVARMMAHFQQVLHEVVANPEKRVSELELLSPAERQQLLVEWNTTEATYAAACVHELVAKQARMTPNAVAVRCGNETLSYEELDQRANQLARYLRRCNFAPESRVGLYLDRSIEMLVALLGVLKAGAVYVPLDPAFPKERIAFIAEDSKLAFLITQQHLVASLPESSAETVVIDRDWIDISRESSDSVDFGVKPENLAYVLYTSGSTGKPKGVQIEHRAVVNFLTSMANEPGIHSDDVLVAVTTLSFDIAGLELYLPLTCGAQVVIASREQAADGAQLLRLMSDTKATTMQATPATWRLLFDSGWKRDPKVKVLCGGEALPRELADQLRPCCCELWNMYGPTETTIWSSVYRIEDTNWSLAPIGRPIANTQMYVLDANRRPVPLGVVGELYIGGDGLARGYWDRPELTAEKFVSNPFQAGTRLYRTGDLARYLPDGNLQYLGRIDNQVKVRGFRIELGEIEAVLAQHESVQQAVVVAREDTPGDKRLVAYVIPNAEKPCTREELRNYLKQTLPEYMVPSAFVALDRFPLTPNGKVDRRALPVPDQSAQEPRRSKVPPRNAIEEVVGSIWTEVFGVVDIGAHDDFFDLGGHSLLATRVISRLRQALQVELPLRAVFEASTVAGLAERIEKAQQSDSGLTAPPILPVERNQNLPLSFAQQRLWFLDQLEPNNPLYNIPWAFRLTGALNREALHASLHEIVRRHETLRTTFVTQENVPVQVVTPKLELDLPVIDLSSHADPESEARRTVLAEVAHPFDLSQGPLIRASLIKLGAEDHILAVNIHHIVSDRWSIGVLTHELIALYRAFSEGKSSPLPDLPFHYADFAVWQRQWLSGEVLDRQIAYWKKQLEGAPQVLDLPTDRPRPPKETFRGDIKGIPVPAAVAEQLKTLSRREGVTLFMTLLAAWNVLLSRYSGQDDIVVGAPIANRNRSDIEGLIGYFANTLTLRSDLSGNPTFRELLSRVRETALGAYAHQDLPFEKLVEELRPERSLSHNPLFQVLFALQNTPELDQQIPGLKLRAVGAKVGTSKCDLALFMAEGPNGLLGRLEYSTDIFEASTIERLVMHFQTLLEAAVADSDCRIADLPLLTSAENDKLLLDWNETEADYPRSLCLHQVFEKQVERTPDAVAVTFADQSLTYAELNCRANRLAHWLQKRRVGPKDMVGVFVERSLEMMVALLAVQKAGAAYVPIDPAYPTDRLAFMLEDAQVPVLLTQESLLPSIPAQRGELLCLDRDQCLWTSESADNPSSTVKPNDLVYVIFTSGSTGRPKGVQVPHRAVVNLLTSMSNILDMGPRDVLVALASFAFDMCIPELYLPLITGGQVVIGQRELAADGEALARLLSKVGATVIHATPTTWSLLLDAGYTGAGKKRVVGAEPLPKDLCERLLEAYPSLYNFYGPTETTVWSTYHEFRSKDEPLTIGRPLANTQVYILDKNQRTVPIGVAGELYIGGNGITKGYLNRPDLTAEKFVRNLFSADPNAKLYRTGDLARYLEDGRIEFLGRIDNQVKVRGYRIELGEIEAALSSHESVQQAVVVVREDRPGDKRLVAYIVPVGGKTPNPTDLRSLVKSKLPDYMVPTGFVLLDKLPLNANGKVDRKALATAESARPQLEGEFIAPRTPIEEAVAGIWEEVLHADRVGAHDDFFALGGHSLLATQVMSRIRQVFQVEIPLRTIFEASTVVALGARIEQERSAARGLQTPPITPARRDERIPLSFSQQRLWVLDQLQPNNPIYNMPQALRLSGTLDLDLLRRSLNELVRRHEVLRTTFAIEGDQPFQVISPTLTLDIPIRDLGGVGTDRREQETARLVAQEARKPFDLSKGPLVRAMLLRLGDQDHVLFLNVHHILSDRWSQGVFARDLAAVYKAFAGGKPSPLPELPLQYADFATWQRNWLQGEVLRKQLSYWTSKLTDAPPVLELPTDRPRPAIETFRGDTRFTVLPSGLAEKLKALSRREGVTLFMTLLATFNVLLSRLSGQEDIVVGSPIANRNRAEVEDLIGFFVNTLVLRTDVSGNPTFRELLSRVRELALDAYAHQDLPFEKLVEEMRLERSLSYNPLFQVMFALQNAPGAGMDLPGIKLTRFGVNNGTSMFDLSMFMVESSEGLIVRLEYNTDLFDPSTVDAFVSRFQLLLESFVASPEQRIAEAPVLFDQEYDQLLNTLNDTHVEYANTKCVHELIAAQVERTPDAIAVSFGDQRLTYAELDCRANQLARYLQTRGVGPDILVGICLERSINMLVAVLGVLKAGGAYVPLDPAYPKDRIAFILEDANAPILLTESSLADTIPSTAAAVIHLDQDWPAILACSTAPTHSKARPNNLAYVIYTSGSTGKPKGVQIEHRSVLNFLCSMRHEPGLKPQDALLAVTTLSFDIAGLELYLPLTVGSQLVIASREEAQDGQQLIAKLEGENITFLQATPATWRVLLEAGWQGNPRLKILCGGEAFPRELAEQLLPRCGGLWNMYGPTETTIWSTCHRVMEGETGPVSIGRPIANTDLFILNAYRRPVPIGVAGELYIGGDGLARGYLNRTELTDEKFVPHPFAEGKRLYRTGDLVRYRKDGSIVFLGRIDNQVKVRGFRIELGEIESVLTEHDGVQQSVVVTRETEPGNQQIVAYVIPDPDYKTGQEKANHALAGEQLDQWAAAWDQTYQQTESGALADFNVAGWNSSYTGLPIGQDEMREWVECTVDRIRGLHPKRVLELGCGTGLLLLRLARSCHHYHGIDFSESALQSIRRQLGPTSRLPVTLSCGSADDLSQIAAGSLDTVILNSVSQYFPTIDYLATVLQNAAEKLENGGVIFVGDVRSLPLLDAFHTAVQLHQAPASMSCQELLGRVERRAEQEEELVIDPAFFTALQSRIPRINRAEVLLKRGRYVTEMTQFRYDVILHIGDKPAEEVDCPWLDWNERGLGIAELRQILEETGPDMLGITNVPNARIWEAVNAVSRLTKGDAPGTVGELRNQLRNASPASLVDPDELWALGRELPYSASITWAASGADGHCEVICRRRNARWAVPRRPKPVLRPWNTYANDPLRAAATRKLVPELRRWLNDRLPDYMVPSALVMLDAFPLTPNGKVDRRALPAPDAARRGKTVGPRNETERMLVPIWQKLLGVQPIGVTDNFFELGGHSLLAVRLMSEIQKETGRLMPLATLFHGATIEYLAQILRQESKPAHQTIVEIQGGTAKPAFFGIVTPGVNALGYVALARHLGQDQPVYRIQGPGPRTVLPYTAADFERLAAEYIQAIKAVQPEGPYYLGGMCEGARIAFDMARLLEARGERVALVAILDTWVIENSQNRFLWMCFYYGQRVRRLLAQPTAQQWRGTRTAVSTVLKRIFRPAKTPKTAWAAAYWPGKDFVPKKYGGKLTLFKIPSQPFFYVRDPLMGWGTRTTGEVEVRLIAGEHSFILREPHVQSVAKALSTTLNALHTKTFPVPALPVSPSATQTTKTASWKAASSLEPPTNSKIGEKALTAVQESKVTPSNQTDTISPVTSPARLLLPMSAEQQRLWLLDQLEHSGPAHNLPLCLRITGNLNQPALTRSLRMVLERHRVLRSRFTLQNGDPARIDIEETAFDLEPVDLTYLRESEAIEKAHALVAEEGRRPFDLQHDLMVRGLLVKLRPQQHLLVLVVHRIVCDGPSTNLLVRELLTAYQALAEGKKPALSKISWQYSDHILWQKRRLEQGALEPDLAYWKHQLAGAGGIELPTDHTRPAQQSFRGRIKTAAIQGDLLKQLRELSQKAGLPLFVALCTAFICLLKRYSGVDDIVIGTEASGREQAETAGLIGPFVNNLVLRTDCSGDPSFAELLKRVHRVWDEAHQHRGLAFETLLENLHLRRDLSRNPLFQVMFAHREALDTITASQATFQPYAMERGSEPLDLTVTVFENAHGCEAQFSYCVDLFSDSTIERMVGHFLTLLEGIAAGPHCKLSALPLLTSAETRQIVVEWNNTAVPYPRDVALNAFIEQQVERTPDSVALVCESERLTYRELNNRSNQLAHALRKRGVGPDALVGVCAERSVEMVIALLGIIKAGGGYVPLDPEYPCERLEGMLKDANPTVVLTQEHLLDRLPKSDKPVVCLDRDWHSIAGEETQNLPILVNGKNIAYTIYTSGSTGRPKGVPNTHAGIVNRLLWGQDKYKLSPADRLLQKTPYSFDVSVPEFFWPLMTGARLVMARPGGHKDPGYLVDIIQQEKITTIHFVPSMLSIFLEADGIEHCRSVRQVFTSGEALPYELQQRLFQRLTAELHNLYGPTEAAVEVTYWECHTVNSDQTIVPIGRPIANTQIYILDANLQPVPIGVAGELHIGGRGLARGYLNRPELTAEKFIRSPFSDDPEARLYKSGDLARFLTDGNIEFLGRIDHQVKLRGFRIELGEIESVLAEHASVRQAVVTVREDIPGDKRLVAYIVPVLGDSPDFDSLRNHATSKLPEYMVPSKFVLLDKLPMTTSGKVDRKALPAPQAEHKDHAVIEPRTELEALLIDIYRKILGVQLVGVTDDFFDLGGHSLMAARMLSEVRHATGKKIPLALLFRGATPEFLATVIERGIHMPPEPIAMLIQSGDALPPFFTVVPPGENAVGYMKLARHVGPHQPFYKLQGPGPVLLDRPYTPAEMQELANRYVDAMRTVQPEGPYYFGGLCDGAHIGFRMAQRLEEQGQEIGMFAIFDTWVLENSQRHFLWLIDYYSQRYLHFRKLRWIDQLRAITRNLWKLSNKALGRRPERSAWAEAYWPEDNFVAPAISGRVTLFKRPKQPYYRLRDPEMGWGARAAGGVDVQVLPIDHEEMLREPHVQILARRLRERLLDYYASRQKEKLNGSSSYAAVGSESEVS